MNLGLPTWLTTGAPTTFVAEILVVIALLIAVAAVVFGDKLAPVGQLPSKRTRNVWLANERNTAALLGMSFRTWITVRVVAVVVGLLFGLLSGIPLLLVAGVLAGGIGIRWAMKPRVYKRQLDTERLFLDEIKTLRNLIFEQGIGLDKSITEVASNCDDSLRYIMAPILTDGSLEDRLVEVAKRAHSPLVSQICSSLVVTRSHDPSVLEKILNENLIPLGEGRQQVGMTTMTLLQTQDSYMYAITFLMAGFLLISQRVPSFHAFYSSFIGQGVLIGDLGVFCGLLYLMNRFLSIPPGYDLDVAEVADRMGARIV